MAVRTILTWPNHRLGIKSEPITNFDDHLVTIVNDLIDTLRCNYGAGLAAPQVNIHSRVVVIDCSKFDVVSPDPYGGDDTLLVLINPILDLSHDKQSWNEACLSVPNVEGKVSRASSTVVTYYSVENRPKQIRVQWPLAGAIQHECDHLDGILYMANMSSFNRRMLIKQLRRAHQQRIAAMQTEPTDKKKKGSTRSMKVKKNRKRLSKKFGVTKRQRKK